MAYPNYAITRIEEYLAALADGSASEKAILASAIEEGGLGWIEPAQVLYETDAATEEISLTTPIIELTEGDSLTLSFTLGSDPAVEATATVTAVDDVLTAAFELSNSQTVTITDEAITFSTDPDGAAFTVTQPAVVHMIDSDFLPPSPVPTPSVSDAGKAIVVNNSGEYALDNVGDAIALSIDPVTHALNMTWAEVDAANRAHRSFVIERDSDDNHTRVSIIAIDTTKNPESISPRYAVSLTVGDNNGVSTRALTADSENDYPIVAPT